MEELGSLQAEGVAARPYISLHLAASRCISLHLHMQAESVAARQALSAEGAARLSAAEAEAGEHARAAVQAGTALRQAREALANPNPDLHPNPNPNRRQARGALAP